MDPNPQHPQHPQHPQPHPSESGVALILTLIFAILLYVLIAELVVSGRMVRLTGENDALLARMSNQMDYTLNKIEEMLLDDLAAASAGEEGGGAGGAGLGGLAGMTGAEGGAGAEGLPGEEEEPDAAAIADSSRDAWFQPNAYADGDLTTYVWVEDENRKFNLLSMWSPDEDFARFSRDRFLRLLDVLREDTEYDLTYSDAERIATDLDDWVQSRTRTDSIPRPPLKTDDDERPDLSIPLHLDELMMLPTVDEDLFFDKVIDGRPILGLESVLTIYTSLGFDPGTPEQQQRERARQQTEGESGQQSPGAPVPGEGVTPGGPPGENPNAPPPQPEGQGIRININTAPRPVLRALFPRDQVPDLVIDAILEYRNEEVDEEGGDGSGLDDYFGDLQLGDETPRQVFTEVSQLEEIPEFANLPDPELKADFMRDVATTSDVFSVHMAAMFRRNDENRVFVLRRTRSILMRREDGEEGSLHPIILQEERRGIRVMPEDFPRRLDDLHLSYSEMDYFAQEERAWNPFLRDFYMPPDQRDQFYYPR